MDTIRDKIANNIKRFRLSSGMNVDEVGAYVGKSGKTVSAWEVGRGQPDADTLIGLCNLFSVDIADFYGEASATKPLSADEERLVCLYRSMTDNGKAAMVVVAEGLAKAFGA